MKIDRKINIAVVGVGNLGQHHARIYSEMEDVHLAGVIDTDEKQLEKISNKLAVPGYKDYHTILDKVDGISVSTPTRTHCSIGKDIILQGIHCLIEKPITTNLEEAEKLIELARQKNVILQIGHIERFNPAVIEAQKFIKNPKFIEAYRLSNYDPRVSDIGVVLDLMIHDLDIILYLVNSKIKNVESYGAKVFSMHEDMVKVRIWFENGCIADVTASRISPGRYRKIRIFQSDAYVSLDYMRQMIKIYRKKKLKVESMDDIEMIRPKLTKGEPLRLELSHFINCIKEGKKPLVSGEHGRDAVELGIEILNKLKRYE